MGKRWRNASGQRIRNDAGDRIIDDTDCCCDEGDPCEGVDFVALAEAITVDGVFGTGSGRYIEVNAPPAPAGYAYCGDSSWSFQSPCGTPASASVSATTAADTECGDTSTVPTQIEGVVGTNGTFAAYFSAKLINTETNQECDAVELWVIGHIACDGVKIQDFGVTGDASPDCLDAPGDYFFPIEVPDTITMDIDLELIDPPNPAVYTDPNGCDKANCLGSEVPTSISLVLTKTTDTFSSVIWEGAYEMPAWCRGGGSFEEKAYDYSISAIVRLYSPTFPAVTGACKVSAGCSVGLTGSGGSTTFESGPSNLHSVPVDLEAEGTLYELDEFTPPPCVGPGSEWTAAGVPAYSGVITGSFTL